MKINLKLFILFPVLLLLSMHSYAQKKESRKAEKAAKKANRIELVQADELEGGKYKGEPVRKLRGSVIFKQNDVTMYCDSAFQYTKKNAIDAFGNVRIQQGDSITMTGNTLFYDGDTRKAKVNGNVVLKDPQMTLSTQRLDYDLKNKVAYYGSNGTIIDGNTTLTSKQGFYNTTNKVFRFRKDVIANNPTENFRLESDTLHYHTGSKVATFFGPTKIDSKDGVLYANEGTYNTKTAEYTFGKQAQVKTEAYGIYGDNMYHDEKKNVTILTGRVKLTVPNDSLIIESDHARHWGKDGIAKVYGNVLMKQYSKGDTLYLTADTLISVDKKETGEKKLTAYNKVKIFKSDLQAKSDSMVYNFADSTIFFYDDPLLWSDQSQIIGDSIKLEMANNKPNKMHVNVNSFIVSQDTMTNYNQIKGRNMTAFFKEGKMDRVIVNGNAESLYFALENEKKLMGMNKSLCSDMVIRFADNKAHLITFLAKPDASFIPPKELNESKRKLSGFKWRVDERPNLETLTGIRPKNTQENISEAFNKNKVIEKINK